MGGGVGEVHGAKLVGLLQRALRDRPAGVLLLAESGGVRLHEANAGLIAVSEVMRAVLDVRIGYGEDLDKVRRVLTELFHDCWLHPEFRAQVMEEPEVWGVERMDPDALVVRVAIKTVPLEQWDVARDLRLRIRERLRQEGIEIPLPQRVVWHRDAPVSAPVSADDCPAG